MKDFRKLQQFYVVYKLITHLWVVDNTNQLTYFL